MTTFQIHQRVRVVGGRYKDRVGYIDKLPDEHGFYLVDIDQMRLNATERLSMPGHGASKPIHIKLLASQLF